MVLGQTGLHSTGPDWCTVSLSLLAGCSSDSSEDSTYSLRSSASLPPEPVNREVQHLRGLRQEPVSSQASEFILFTCVIINVLFLLTMRINHQPDCVQMRGV